MRAGGESGSALIFVLLVCLGAVVLILALGAAIGVRVDAIEVESDGRIELARVETALSELRALAAESWAPTQTMLGAGATGSLAEIVGAGGRVLLAEARVPTSTGTRIASARLELADDGVTLPRRVIAARAVFTGPSRPDPAVGIDPGSGVSGSPTDLALGASETALITTMAQPPVGILGPGVTADPQPQAWAMDPGTTALGASGAAEGAAGLVGLGRGIPLSAALTGDTGRQPETPALIIGDASAPVNACGLGDLYAVILAGNGGIDLEGTVVHGAVFTEGDVRLGATGAVLFRKGVWAWATQGSLVRVRLVRGTRIESFEPRSP
ncbi:MAG: hypothetical protein ACYC33_01420 [Thermoleophilia bacterium]